MLIAGDANRVPTEPLFDSSLFALTQKGLCANPSLPGGWIATAGETEGAAACGAKFCLRFPLEGVGVWGEERTGAVLAESRGSLALGGRVGGLFQICLMP